MTGDERLIAREERACLGMPLAQAQSMLRALGIEKDIVYTGTRAAAEHLTPRVIALRENALVVAWFRDGDPRTEET